jgi:hypothetical protein
VLRDLNYVISAARTAQYLRLLAALLRDSADGTSSWLSSDSALVPKVLAILRSIKSGCAPDEAVTICSSAVAALHSVLTGLRQADDICTFCALLQADSEACDAVVLWGLARPECSEQLPPGNQLPPRIDLKMCPPGSDAAKLDHPFWTHLTVCGSFLVALDNALAGKAGAHKSARSEPHGVELQAGLLQKAASLDVVERLLLVAIQQPCGKYSLCAAAVCAAQFSLRCHVMSRTHCCHLLACAVLLHGILR